jgi:hypothetical protein
MKVIYIAISVIIYAVDGVIPVVSDISHEVIVVKTHIRIHDSHDYGGISLCAVPSSKHTEVGEAVVLGMHIIGRIGHPLWREFRRASPKSLGNILGFRISDSRAALPELSHIYRRKRHLIFQHIDRALGTKLGR